MQHNLLCWLYYIIFFKKIDKIINKKNLIAIKIVNIIKKL